MKRIGLQLCAYVHEHVHSKQFLMTSRVLLSSRAQQVKESESFGIPMRKIIVVSSANVAAVVDSLMKEDILGFDTESSPFNFPELKSYESSAPHLVQLSTRNNAFLFHYERAGLFVDALRPILESPRITKVGFGVIQDADLLKAKYGLCLQNVLDLGIELRSRKQYSVGLSTAVTTYLGVAFKKRRKIQLSNWGIPIQQYSPAKLIYAANDAYLALKVYDAWNANNREIRVIQKYEEAHAKMLEQRALRGNMGKRKQEELRASTVQGTAVRPIDEIMKAMVVALAPSQPTTVLQE